MSRNGNKHLSHKASCKAYTTSGRCAINRQKRIKRAEQGIKENSHKMPETAQMIWDRVIKNCPKGGTVNEVAELKKRGALQGEVPVNEIINLGWPRRYRYFGKLTKWQNGRVAERMSTAKAAVKAKKETRKAVTNGK